ncbi:MAG TPA: response regulator transcription factor [Actinocrinis sp.]|nr:response regulator transcription factor [Actinocrinis sp.]
MVGRHAVDSSGERGSGADRSAPAPAPPAPGLQKALVVEDAPDVAQLICETLRQSGFESSVVDMGAQALKVAQSLQPDLITLDLTLPDMDGIEVCRRLRTMTNAYIVMLSARTEEMDRLVGLEVGADDYMVKPFSPRELRSRVGALFRRPRLADPTRAAEEGAHRVLRSGDLVVDQETRLVTLAGASVELTRIEFDLLELFITRPRRVWDRDTLVQQVWGTEWMDAHVIDVHVANLRRKLGDDAREARWIVTVRGVGYRFGGPNPSP